MIGSPKAVENKVKEARATAFVALVAKLSKKQRAQLPLYLVKKQKNAQGLLTQSGLPIGNIEQWKYTNLDGLLKPDYTFDVKAQKAELPDTLLYRSYNKRVVFVNGVYDEALSSLPKGLKITSFASVRKGVVDALLGSVVTMTERSDGLVRLNTAYFTQGYLLEASEKIKETVHVVQLVDGQDGPVFIQPRVLVLVNKGATLSLVVSQSATFKKSWINSVMEVVVSEKGRLKLGLVQADDVSVVTQRLAVAVDKNAEADLFTLSTKLSFVRNDVHVYLRDKGATTALHGLVLGHGTDHVDNHTCIQHLAPQTTSNQVYKSVLGNSSRVVFDGRVVVQENAVDSESHQLNKNIILSDDAVMYTKPQLEIFVDDVICTHGASTGQVNDDSLFYLRSRGLNAATAKAMLLQGFVQDVLDLISIRKLDTIIKEDYL